MLLKVREISPGLHPSETFVSFEARDGTQEVAVDSQSLQNSTIPVGWPVGQENDYWLIELPRPTISGSRRVWVAKNELVPERTKRKTA
jgi:hypothetical protein